MTAPRPEWRAWQATLRRQYGMAGARALTTGWAAAQTSVHEPSSLQALDNTGIANRPTANPTATTGASGSGTTSTTAASARCGRADGE